jgi:hypothetical protein
MIIVISPAKKLDYKTPVNTKQYSIPELTEHSKILIEELRKCSIEDLTKLMNISYGLAETNLQRFLQWQLPFTPENAKPAILAFNGDVYEGLNAKNFDEQDFDFAQKHLRIISGLYGILKPLDLIQPYRLPMGTKLQNPKGKNLYQFWNDIITQQLNKDIKKNNEKYLINLASNEYFKAIKPEKLKAQIIDIAFKENKNGVYRVVSFYAKKARGLMSKYIIKNKINKIEDLKGFNEANYYFDSEQSTKNKLVFVR